MFIFSYKFISLLLCDGSSFLLCVKTKKDTCSPYFVRRQIQYAPRTMLSLIITVWTAKYSFVTQFQINSSRSSSRNTIEMMFKRTLSTEGLESNERKKNGKGMKRSPRRVLHKQTRRQKSQTEIVEFVHSPIVGRRLCMYSCIHWQF